MLAALSTGCTGFVGSTFSVAGKLFDRILNAFAKGDWEEARKEMSHAREFIALVNYAGNKYGDGVDSITLFKAIWGFQGVEAGPSRTFG